MAEIEQNNTGGNGSNSATTVLIAVIVILIIGIAFYFGFVRDNLGSDGGTNIDINATVPAGSGIDAGPAE